jgi:hypothetical protein
LECAFGVVLDVQDLMEFIWIQNVEDIDFKVNSATKSSNKFQKTRFWKEKSVEDMVTLPSTTQATVVLMMHKLEWIDVGGHALFLTRNVRKCVVHVYTSLGRLIHGLGTQVNFLNSKGLQRTNMDFY